MSSLTILSRLSDKALLALLKAMRKEVKNK
jgi:hypothetical protein